MKSQKFFTVLVIFAMMIMLAPVAGVMAAPAEKKDVCHLDDTGGYHMINISENAFQTHLDHGDAAPGEAVPGQSDKKFTTDCSVINVKELIDTVTVPSTGGIVYSKTLDDGVVYEFEASGTYEFIKTWPGAGTADARCSLRIPGSLSNEPIISWIDGANLTSYKYYLQIWVNGSTFEWGTGCNELTHIYTSSFTGLGAPVSFKIVDNATGDNSGELTVKIYKYN